MQNKNITHLDRVFFSLTGSEIDERKELGFEKRFEKNDEGFLEGRAPVTNVGVFSYKLPDGTIRRELRLPEEVFAQESLDSLKMKPLTNDHPKEAVNADNAKKLQVGYLGENVDFDAYRVFSTIVITDKKTIDDVTAGKRSLSCGYFADIEYKSGVWMGVAYDAIQRNIRYNHVAVVDNGRAGDDAVMNIDSSDALGKLTYNQQAKEITMLKKITLDGVEYEAEAKVLEALNSTKIKLDSLEKETKEIKANSEKIEAERDSFKERIDSLEEELKGTIKTDSIDLLIKKRIALLDVASKAKIEVKEDMAEIDIKKAIILKAFPKADMAEKSDVYIDARFDSAVELLNSDSVQTFQNIADNQQKNDSAVESSEKARLRYIENLKKAHKGEE